MRCAALARLPRAVPASIRMEVLNGSLDLDPRIGRRRAGHAGDRDRPRGSGDLPVPAVKLPATIIPALAVPVSLIGTCAAMYAFGFSINNMTLLALTLSVGFVVDDAIVMLENIVRHIEGGMRPFEAALKGAREIGFTIISITFSLIAVFIPVLADGRHGRPGVSRVRRHHLGCDHRFRLCLADAHADVVRARVAARITRRKAERRCCASSRRVQRAGCAAMNGRSIRSWRYKFGHARRSPSPRMHRHRFGSTIVIPKGFFPTEDTGFICGDVEAPSDISFKAMLDRAAPDRRRSSAPIKAVDYVNSTIGVGWAQSDHQQRAHVHRAQAEERARKRRPR